MRATIASAALTAALLTVMPDPGVRARQSGWLDDYRDAAERLISASLASTFAWDRLALLGDTFGHRLSGSRALEHAIAWAVAEMKKDGLENVRAEPVKVPHWVRGSESLEIVTPHRSALAMLGLGNSVGTPAAGIEAEVLVVANFAGARGRAVRARRAGSCSSTLHSRATAKPSCTAPRAHHAPRARAPSPRWCDPSDRRGCGHRTRAPCATLTASRRSPRPPSPPRTPIDSSACRTAARRSRCA